MKKLFIVFVIASLTFIGCGKDEHGTATNTNTTKEVEQFKGRNVSGFESGMINGNVTTIGEYQLAGMLNGNASVSDKSTFNLDGTVSGNISVKQGGKLFVNGTVNGTVYNEGGFVEIRGTVGGLTTTNDGKSIVDKNAMVGGKKAQ